MTFHGDARLPRSDAEGNFSLKTTVPGSGASTLDTALYVVLRMLRTPAGGKKIFSYVGLTSAAVSGGPSWNRIPRRILNLERRPPGAIFPAVAASPMIFG